MNSALGHGLVLLALLLCAIGAPLGFVAGARRSEVGLRRLRWIALAFAAATILANLVMSWALVRHDFSVSYVAQVGSTTTPLAITLVSLWSSLEGSILFWAMILGIYTGLVAILQRRGHEDYLAYTLATMLGVSIFFLALIAGPANPFAPTPLPVPLDGPGPNPLLQNHLLMIVHPPMLYLGYVGMTVPFAMAVAALLRGSLGATWLRPMRNWLLVPTSFLTAGIMLGGWWSYEVLGWGGYWAWDPVENASFLPWLTGIAAVHSAVVQQRRGNLKAWTTVLIMITFLLTILGTFLTRSGVVNSVHSFTQSPIGPLFLGFLGVTSIAVIVLLSLRIDTLATPNRSSGLLSREGTFLLNNLILIAIMFTVLVGTLFPIIAEAVRGVKVSVGEPYFNRMAVPLFLVLVLLMGIGPALPWGGADAATRRRLLLRPLPAAIAGGVLVALFLDPAPMMIVVGCIVGYTLWVTIDQGSLPARIRRRRGEKPIAALQTATRLLPRRLGAFIVHFGVVMVFLSVALSSSFQQEVQATLLPGSAVDIGDYRAAYRGTRLVEEAHVAKQVATVEISKNGRPVATLQPSLNFYPTRREPIGTPAVRTGPGHDLYLTLMNVGSDGSIGLRAILTPAVVWIWIGVSIMVAGTLLCLVPPRTVATAAVAKQDPVPTDQSVGGQAASLGAEESA